jgi:cytosine/adenosine deaminase-related metal-dependent hydrolase
VIENCAIATMDGPRHDQGGAEHRRGHVTVTGDRIAAVGEGPAGSVPDGGRRIDAGGCLATPGLVNAHHHLYQWLTQGRAQQSVLFDWLTELYPVWATIDAGQVHAAATAGPAGLGVDGAASSEGSSLAGELHQALLAARVRDERGPAALTARQALWLGTRGGARCLGRDDETGALRPGMLAISRCGGSTASRTTRSPTAPAATRSRPWCSGRPPRSSCSWSAAHRWWTAANCAPSTPPRPPARSGRPGFACSVPS